MSRPSVCTHNSARSQMAKGLLRGRHGDRYEAFSAGTEARGVHPLAAAVLREVGVDPSRQSSKTIESLGDRPFSVVVTVCDAAREACPYFPAQDRTLHRSFRDPSAVEGTEAERLDAFREVRDEITAWLDAEFGEGVAVVQARLPHRDAVLRLLADAGLPTEDLGPDALDAFPVALDGDDVVGTVAVEAYGEDGLLRSLAVTPGRRGRRLGKRLVGVAEADARRRGLRSLALLTTTAAPFFESLGYAPAERAAVPEAIRQSSEFAGICPSSAACLTKRLGAQ